MADEHVLPSRNAAIMAQVLSCHGAQMNSRPWLDHTTSPGMSTDPLKDVSARAIVMIHGAFGPCMRGKRGVQATASAPHPTATSARHIASMLRKDVCRRRPWVRTWPSWFVPDCLPLS